MLAAAVAPQFIVDPILPSNRVHLLSGPSLSGKSTFMLQLLSDWISGRPILGFPAIPYSPGDFHIISCDRTSSHLSDIIRRLNLPSADFPRFSTVDQLHDRERLGDYQLLELIQQVRSSSTRLKLLVIDGFATLCPGKIIDHSEVSRFLRGAGELCRRLNLTILGTVYASKSRVESSSPLDSILGCSAWSAYTETKIVLEPSHKLTTVHVLCPNYRPLSLTMQQDEATGLFLEASVELCEILDRWLAQVDHGTILTTQQIQSVAEQAKVSRATCTRWISGQVSLGTLRRIDRGEYIVHRANEN